jgi:signal transduction histidine kinase
MTARLSQVLPKAHELLRQAIAGIVHDLCTLSLVDPRGLTVDRSPSEPSRLLEWMVVLYEQVAQHLGVSQWADAPVDLPLTDENQERMAQVLGNLFGNGPRLTPEGGTITLAARSSARGDTVWIDVEV